MFRQRSEHREAQRRSVYGERVNHSLVREPDTCAVSNPPGDGAIRPLVPGLRMNPAVPHGLGESAEEPCVADLERVRTRPHHGPNR